MKIKVCGMRDAGNIQQLKKLKPDYLGFIFYPKSPRFVGEIDPNILKGLTPIKKTAVFVNASLEEVENTIRIHDFDAVQLHGQESAEFCLALKKPGLEVIKAFGIHEEFDWNALASFEEVVDYFLFDAFTDKHGGSGQVFNWKVLDRYTLGNPYFLSGGLGPAEIASAFLLNDERLYGLDLNSKFETSPGMKNIELLETVLKNKNE